MDQNNNPVDDELQKAIDEITNSTTDTEQPAVFPDAVAAPADLPELNPENLASFDAPAPAPDFNAAPELNTTDFSAYNVPEMTGPVEPIGPFEAPEAAPAPAGDFVSTALGDAPIVSETPAEVTTSGVTANTDMTGAEAEVASDLKEIQDAALKDLIPVLDELTELDAAEKYHLCLSAYDKERDPAILKTALSSAKQIADPKERATALLSIVKAN